ncbi:hypothetical protein Fcan01_09544 [Folsomia candida]|uniref:Uncharacterized protein n=1 Tax=Folsomia candida TaxID=158441 RepID=A0A226EDV0_FOLCA|nr:hypothetical protein Fcan01_09544 [Folsomia candida]
MLPARLVICVVRILLFEKVYKKMIRFSQANHQAFSSFLSILYIILWHMLLSVRPRHEFSLANKTSLSSSLVVMMIIIIYPSIHGPVELTTSNQNLLQREVVILHRSWLEDWSKRWAKVAKVKHSIRQKTWRENRVLHSSIHPFLFPAKPSQNLSHPSSCSLTEEEELKKHPLHSQLTSFIIMVAKEGTVGFGY